MAKSDILLRLGLNPKNLIDGLKTAKENLKKFSFRAETVGRDLTTRLTLPILGAGYAAVKTFADFDRLEKGLAALNGSAEGGRKSFKRLNAIVLDTRTTLDLKTAALAAQRLQGAGLSAAFAERTIKQLGIAATVSGSSIEDVNGVVRQLTQIIGKGKVEQEDFNSILDRMPAIGALMKKEFGGVTAKAINATGISMEVFVDRLVGAIEKNKDFQNVQGGLAKAFESFANSVQVGIKPLGEAIAKSLNLEKNLERLSAFITRASEAFAALDPKLQRFIVFSAAGAAAVGPLVFGIGAAAKVITAMSSSFAILTGPLAFVTKGLFAIGKNLVLYASVLKGGGAIGRTLVFGEILGKIKIVFAALTGPLVLIVAGIVLLTAAFVKAYKNSEFFRDQIGRLGQAFSDIFSPIGKLVGSLFPSLSSSFKSVGAVFNFIFSGIAAVISAIIEKFLTIVDTVKAVIGVIQGFVNKDLKQVLSSAKDAFDLTLGGKAGKRVGDAFGTTFDQTLRGNLKRTFASKEVRDFASLIGGVNLDTKFDGDLPGTIAAPVPVDVKPPKPKPTGIKKFKNESIAAFAEVGLEVARLSARFNALDDVKIELPTIGGQTGVSILVTSMQEYEKALEVIDRKQLAFGSSFDGLSESIGTTKSAIDDLLEGSFTKMDPVVAELIKKYEKFTAAQTEQAEAQAESDKRLEITTSFFEGLGIVVDKAFNALTKGQKIIGSAIAATAMVAENAFDGMASGVTSFGAALATATREIIGNLIKQGVAAVVNGALLKSSFLGPFAVPIAAAAGAAANALFQGLLSSIGIPALAQGGITTGAQVALIGEAGPEAVVPLPTLDALIQRAGGGGSGGGGNVEFVIRGEDLIGVLSKSNSSYNRSY